MKQVIKRFKLIGLVMIIGICFNAVSVNAQSPADDPGIGGPGSPGNGPSGDGGPIVPFDANLSIVLLAVGIAYSAKRLNTRFV